MSGNREGLNRRWCHCTAYNTRQAAEKQKKHLEERSVRKGKPIMEKEVVECQTCQAFHLIKK